MEFGKNPYSTEDTSLEDRAKLLKQFIAALVRDPAGPDSAQDLEFMVRVPDLAVPYNIHGRSGYRPRGEQYSYSGDRILEALREHRHAGYQLSWNCPEAGTENLISVDADSQAIYDACPDTLEVISGSGNRHCIYANPAGDIESEWLNKDSCINADPSTHTVVPGSVHRGDGDIYSLANWSDITQVSAQDLRGLEAVVSSEE